MKPRQDSANEENGRICQQIRFYSFDRETPAGLNTDAAMCVRYTLHKPEAAATAIGHTLRKPLAVPEWLKPSHNVAVTHIGPSLVCRAGEYDLVPMRWGFPSRDQKQVLPNAKIETVTTLPTFSQAAKGRRCALLTNGFYEWHHVGTERRPHLFSPTTSDALVLAGIWTAALDGVETFALLTTLPNTLVAGVHNRMPVLLTPDNLLPWLQEGPLTPDQWSAFASPASPELLCVREVHSCVGNPRNNSPRCHEPPEPRDEQLTLL